MEKSYIIADFGSYTVEQNTPDYINNLKSLERERKNKRKKEERQATVSAIYGGIISVAFPVALFALWLAIGY